jgi:hypothetical protein
MTQRHQEPQSQVAAQPRCFSPAPGLVGGCWWGRKGFCRGFTLEPCSPKSATSSSLNFSTNQAGSCQPPVFRPPDYYRHHHLIRSKPFSLLLGMIPALMLPTALLHQSCVRHPLSTHLIRPGGSTCIPDGLPTYPAAAMCCCCFLCRCLRTGDRPTPPTTTLPTKLITSS